MDTITLKNLEANIPEENSTHVYVKLRVKLRVRVRVRVRERV